MSWCPASSYKWLLLSRTCRQLEEQEDKLHSQQLTGYGLAAQLAALEKAHAADSEVLAAVPQHTTELEEVSGGWAWCMVTRLAAAAYVWCQQSFSAKLICQGSILMHVAHGNQVVAVVVCTAFKADAKRLIHFVLWLLCLPAGALGAGLNQRQHC
jgi:hypothetical protein